MVAGLRRGIVSKVLFCLAWLWLVGAPPIAPAQARTVGLVFDDSGSMGPILERALFATQLLVSVLDPDDQLYVVRLNGERGQVVGPVDLSRRSAYLQQIRDAWRARGRTPYEPVEALLRKLVEVTPAGEEASLLVITDGGFNDPPSPAQLEQRYQQLKSAFRGKNLSAYFVVLHHQQDLRDLIEKQGVRRTLLTAFNGDPAVGRVDIDESHRVFSGLRDVIAQLYGTDPVDRQRVVTLRNQHIELRPPFSVSRLVVVIPEQAGGRPARFQSASFALHQDPPAFFQPAVRNDRAHVYHARPLQPLPPNVAQTLTFDGPLPADTQVLFDSGLALELSFFDGQGQPLHPDPRGRLVVNQGAELEVRATLVDRLDPAARIVDLGALAHDPVFTLHQGDRAHRMRLDKPHNYASATLRYEHPGPHTLTGVARYPGFITRRGQDLLIEVEPVRSIQLSITPERLDGCAACAPDEALLAYTTQEAYQSVFAFAVAADQVPEPGAYRLELAQRLPSGVRLLLPDGQTTQGGWFARDPTLTLEPGQPARLLLQYNHEYRAEDARSLRLRISPARADWRGDAETTLQLLPHVSPVRFKAAGHTGADPARPFQLALTDLGKKEGVYVAAEGLLRPLQADGLAVRGRTLNFSAIPDGPDRVLVMPEKNWWCDCLTRAGDHAFTLSYHDPELRQRADYSGNVTLLDVPWWEKCWQELLVLLLILLALAKIICLLRAERFPARGRLVIRDLDDAGALRRFPLHSVWSTLLSCRDERRRVGGLELRAAPQGAFIAYQRNYPPGLTLEMTGESIQEIFDRQPRREIAWRWGESLVDSESRQRFILVRDIASFQSNDLNG